VADIDHVKVVISQGQIVLIYKKIGKVISNIGKIGTFIDSASALGIYLFHISQPTLYVKITSNE